MADDIIIDLNDQKLGYKKDELDKKLESREATRGIVINEEQKVALFYTAKHGHHKIPGGGIDPGESWQDAFKREASEEIGYEIEVLPEFLGLALEERYKHNLQQVSYCGVARTVKKLDSRELTEQEVTDGFQEVIWVTLQEAVELFNNDKPKTYLGEFMHKRDQAILKKAIEKLG